MLEGAKFCTRCGAARAGKEDFALACAEGGYFFDENDRLKFSKKNG